MGGCYSTKRESEYRHNFHKIKKKKKNSWGDTDPDVENKSDDNDSNYDSNYDINCDSTNNGALSNKSSNSFSNNGIIIYIVCPNCSERTPHLEGIYYDEKSKDFLVKYTCICKGGKGKFEDVNFEKILSNKRPKNNCNIHTKEQLIGFCKNCNRAICSVCQKEKHSEHEIKEEIITLTQEESDQVMKIIKEREKEINNEVEQSKKKMVMKIDEIINKLKEKKMNYKKELDDYKEKNVKKYSYIKSYMSNTQSGIINSGNSKMEKLKKLEKMENLDKIDNTIIEKRNEEINLDASMPKWDKNLKEILNQYNEEPNNPDKNKNKYDPKAPPSPEKKNNDKAIKFSAFQKLEGHKERIVSLIQLASGKIASGSYDNTVRIWDPLGYRDEEIIEVKAKVFALLEFNDNMLLTGTSNNDIQLWDISNLNSSPNKREVKRDLNSSSNNREAKHVGNFTGHSLWVNCLVKCGRHHFASASNDAMIKIWDYPKQECVVDLIGHRDCVLALTLLLNDYLCSGSADFTIRIWDWRNKKCVRTLGRHTNWVKSVFQLSNGIILSSSDDNTIKIWENYNNIKTIKNHKQPVRTFCQINKDYFASGSFDCTIKIWDMKNWECVQTLFGHNSNILCVISIRIKQPESKIQKYYISSCSNDRNIILWEGVIKSE
jgi:WD40 repeat protein